MATYDLYFGTCTNLPISLQMFTDSDRLLDKMVQILWDLGSQTLSLQDAQDLVAGNESYLRHTMRIPQDHTWRRQIQRVKQTVANNMIRLYERTINKTLTDN